MSEGLSIAAAPEDSVPTDLATSLEALVFQGSFPAPIKTLSMGEFPPQSPGGSYHPGRLCHQVRNWDPGVRLAQAVSPKAASGPSTEVFAVGQMRQRRGCPSRSPEPMWPGNTWGLWPWLHRTNFNSPAGVWQEVSKALLPRQTAKHPSAWRP